MRPKAGNRNVNERPHIGRQVPSVQVDDPDPHPGAGQARRTLADMVGPPELDPFIAGSFDRQRPIIDVAQESPRRLSGGPQRNRVCELNAARHLVGARTPSGGNSGRYCCDAMHLRYARILAMTSASSMLAMIRSVPSQRTQHSVAMPRTHFSRRAKLIATRRGGGCPRSEARIATYLEARLDDGDARAVPFALRTAAEAVGGMAQLAVGLPEGPTAENLTRIGQR